MGVWFLSIALGNLIGGEVSRYFETFALPNLFGAVFLTTAGSALALADNASRSAKRPENRPGRTDTQVAERGVRDWAWLGAAALSVAVAAPLLLLWGLKATPGDDRSLALVRSRLHRAVGAGPSKSTCHPGVVGARVWRAALLALEGGSWESPWAPWLRRRLRALGPRQQLTRNIAMLEPTAVAQFKGLAAGTINLLLLLAVGGSLPRWPALLAALVVGGLSYGLSLVLFVYALRYLGSARTSAYFGAGPFFAAVISLVVARSLPTPSLLAAAALMVVGTVLMVSEQHVHEHRHDGVSHTHWHLPDAQHRHSH
jgi:drug/metabolite transporter (DMT)-like permease